jgi:tRNA pseudouridine38-40 synthase
MRLLLTLQYLGTRYAGWQMQANAVGIQSVVEEVLAKMYGAPIRIEGAGRTDSGVHALAQRAHYDAPFAIPLHGLTRGMNDLLPHDIRVTNVEDVADDFHCRFASKSKTYAYQIWNAELMDVFRWETYAHVAQKLDAQAMHDAAQALKGTQDFKRFTVVEPEVSSTIRTIEHISVLSPESSVVIIRVTADGFLRFMVRRIAGSLIELGRGKVDAVTALMEARWTAPAKGLVLEEIRY